MLQIAFLNEIDRNSSIKLAERCVYVDTELIDEVANVLNERPNFRKLTVCAAAFWIIKKKKKTIVQCSNERSTEMDIYAKKENQ